MKNLRLFFAASSLFIGSTVFGASINCATSADLVAALGSFADGDEIVLTTSGGKYIVVDDVDQSITVGNPVTQPITDKAIRIVAASGLSQKPIVKGLSLATTYTASGTNKNFYFEGVIFEGSVVRWSATEPIVPVYMTDHVVDLGTSANTSYGDFTFRDCVMRNYQQRLFKANSLSSSTTCVGGTFLVINSLFYELNTAGTGAGTNFVFECDRLSFKTVTITRNTFYNNYQGIYNTGQNINNGSSVGAIDISYNTFYKAWGKQGSGGSQMFQFRYNTPSSMTISGSFHHNIVSEFNKFPQIGTGTAALHYFNFGSSNNNATATSNNNIYYLPKTTELSSAIVVDYNGNGNANNLNVPTANRTTYDNVVDTDPLFDDPTNGSFNYTNIAFRDLTVGDPRWIYKQASNIALNEIEGVSIINQTNGIVIESQEELSGRVYDVSGSLVEQRSGNNFFVALKRGVYTVQLSNGTLSKVSKVIVE